MITVFNQCEESELERNRRLEYNALYALLEYIIELMNSNKNNEKGLSNLRRVFTDVSRILSKMNILIAQITVREGVFVVSQVFRST